MPAAGIAALVVTAVLVVALAFYLAWVVVILRRLVDTLGKVQFGVGAIAHRVSPVGEVVHDVNAGLTDVADAVEGFVDEVTHTSRPRAVSGTSGAVT